MSLIRQTASAALAYALSLQGRSRKLGTAVWTDSAVIDDCARFCSHVLWGGNPGRISWVDTFKTSGDGSYHAGKAGLQPGDVVLFDWEGNGVGNHVEFCLTSPASNGAFTTIGANGSDTVAAKVRARNGYVLGYFRPAWGSASPTPAQPRPTEKGSTVTARHFRNTKTKAINLIDPNGIQDWHVPNGDYVNLNEALGVAPQGVKDVPDNQFGFLQQLAQTNVDRIASRTAQLVWAKGIEDTNAATYLSRIRKSADKAAAGTAVTIDDKAADSIAARVFSRIGALFTAKK